MEVQILISDESVLATDKETLKALANSLSAAGQKLIDGAPIGIPRDCNKVIFTKKRVLTLEEAKQGDSGYAVLGFLCDCIYYNGDKVLGNGEQKIGYKGLLEIIRNNGYADGKYKCGTKMADKPDKRGRFWTNLDTSKVV